MRKIVEYKTSPLVRITSISPAQVFANYPLPLIIKYTEKHE